MDILDGTTQLNTIKRYSKDGMSRSMKSYKKQWKDQFKEWIDYYEKNKEKKKNQEVLIVQ